MESDARQQLLDRAVDVARVVADGIHIRRVLEAPDEQDAFPVLEARPVRLRAVDGGQDVHGYIGRLLGQQRLLFVAHHQSQVRGPRCGELLVADVQQGRLPMLLLPDVRLAPLPQEVEVYGVQDQARPGAALAHELGPVSAHVEATQDHGVVQRAPLLQELLEGHGLRSRIEHLHADLFDRARVVAHVVRDL
jgi:hypothetical protein